MKILIYGHNGWIGKQITQLLKIQNLDFVLGKSRIDDSKDLIQEIRNVNPTHIISFTGRTYGNINGKNYSTIDYLEQEGRLTENIRDNLYGPMILALHCRNLNIHLTYLGTGCIFTYDDEHPFGKENNGFSETDKPNFFGSSYSIVKGFTDQIMHEFNNGVLNLRIRMPISISENHRDFITKITTYKKVCSVPNSMSVLPILLPIAIDMITNNKVGTYNLTNPGLISHNQILEMYKEIVNPNFTWENFTLDEQARILDSGRSNNYLDTTKILKEYPDIPNIHEAVRSCLECYTPQTKLLVTGGCGFIGSNFINHIIKTRKDISILNIDAMYYCANKNNIDKSVSKSLRYNFIKGNINDSKILDKILEQYNITQVIHFAAQSHVQNSFDDAASFIKDNIGGTQNLFEAIRKYGKVKKIIHVSTDEVYGESLETQKNENDSLSPTNPYSASKAGAEAIAKSYKHSFKLPIIITRGNNVYGPNQHYEKLIPCFINKALNYEKLTIQGNGETKRAFMYVTDTVNAFETILDKGKIGEIYNIGCDEQNKEYSVLEVARNILDIIKGNNKYILEEEIKFIKDRPFNDRRYFISNDKLKALGWKQQVEFKEGLGKLII
jgi:dTDP-glucose 4,6-dehydratase